MYRSGQSFAQIGAELGKHPESLRRAIQRRRIELRPNTYTAPNRTETPADVAGRYQAGESILALARSYQVSRTVVRRWLSESAVELRTASEANRVRMSKLTAEERSKLASPAHDAVRGSVRGVETRVKFANTRAERAAAGTWKRSHMEQQLGEWMSEQCIQWVPEQVVAGYNVDFGIEPVAVELLGGSWHAQPSRRAHHAKRTHDILNAGWHMIYVWSTHHVPLTRAGADQVVAYVQQASRNPSPVGQYWVLRGDGQLMSSGGDEGDDFTLVVPSIAGLGIRT
ncbi:MAG: helix-turn-helix domain-containing protein [Microcella pacifica]